ncbi:MAG: B12-binding domain-containing protein [Acidimicrobiia bacterium]|nr:B12-binding domain-containing protein [Acidimicrobiia bacterium]
MPPTPVADETLSLRECADRLGVHYMTAYRYVRHGRLVATKVGPEWQVRSGDLAAFLAGPAGGPAPWADRLEARLLAGDHAGAWGVVESALSSGLDPAAVYVRLLAPALRDIGEGWAQGTISVADEHRATAAAARLLGRLGPRFVHRGQSRGRVVIGTPPGERHALAVGMAADHLRGGGWEVIELGCDLPVADFVRVAHEAGPISAIAVSVTMERALRPAHDLIRALRFADLGPILLGGGAVTPEAALRFGADAWAQDGPGGVVAMEEL